MTEENYWSKAMRKRLSRRQAIIGVSQVGLGIFGASVLGCTGQTTNPTATAVPAATKAAGTTPAAGATAAATAAAKAAKKGGTFRVAGGYAVQNVDPHMSSEWLSFDMWRLVSNALIKQKSDNYQLQPDLAESWENPDSTTFVFKLRKGVKFQNKPPVNGRELTADDVKYSIERISTPDPKFPRNSWFSQVAKIEAVDKYTVKFTLKAAYAPFLTNISALQSIIVAKESVDKYGDLLKPEAAVGTGPYLLDAGFRLDVGGLFKRNPDYFDPARPYMDAIQYDVIEDPSSRVAAFRTGKHDICALTTADADSVKGNANIILTPAKEIFALAGLGFNLAKKPFTDVRVRKALHLAADRQQMMSTYCLNNGVQMGPLGYNAAWSLTEDELLQMPGYRKDKTQDIADAKKLLADAGYPNGFEFTAITTDKYSYTHSEPAQIMKQNFTKIGVTMNLTLMEWGAFKAAETAKNFDAEITTLAAGATVDPDSQYAVNYRTGGSRNYWNLSDPELDKMIDDQAKELDITKRQKLVKDIERKILDIMPVVFHAYPAGFGGKYNYVKDLLFLNGTAASFRAYQLMDVWLDK